MLQQNTADVEILLECLKDLGYRFTRPLVARATYLAEPTILKCCGQLEVLHCAPTESGILPMKQMLDNVRLREYKVFALQAPFESKDMLKFKRYRWNAERKVWHTVIQESLFAAEAEWLKVEIYNNKKCRIEREKVDAFSRFSDRISTLEVIDC